MNPETDADLNRTDGGITNLVTLNSAARTGDVALVRDLLDRGAWPDGADETGFTPLMHAAREGHAAVVELLLDAGADVHRLGYVQRFYPLDFAQWDAADAATIAELETRGACTVDTPLEVAGLPGAPVIAHVSRSYAAVYPRPFTRAIGGEDHSLWLGQLRGSSTLLYLFSAGLSGHAARLDTTRIDVGLVLPSPWALLDRYRHPLSVFSFPLDLLQRAGERIAQGAEIGDGTVLSPSDPDLADLSWPAGVRHLLAVDHQWSGDPDAATPAAPGDVTLLTLAPITTTSFTPDEASVQKALAARRTARSTRLALPYYWPDRWA